MANESNNRESPWTTGGRGSKASNKDASQARKSNLPQHFDEELDDEEDDDEEDDEVEDDDEEDDDEEDDEEMKDDNEVEDDEEGYDDEADEAASKRIEALLKDDTSDAPVMDCPPATLTFNVSRGEEVVINLDMVMPVPLLEPTAKWLSKWLQDVEQSGVLARKPACDAKPVGER